LHPEAEVFMGQYPGAGSLKPPGSGLLVYNDPRVYFRLYSAPELEELLEAVNKACEEKSGKSPALVMLKQKTADA
jgi:hypothetical protein